MTKTIENLFIYLSAASDLLIILLFLAFWRKNREDKGLWVIFIYCLLSLLLNSAVEVLFHNFKHLFYTVFTLLEYLLFSAVLWIYIKNQSFKTLIIVFSVLFSTFVLFYIGIRGYHRIDSISIGIETILIIIYSFYYLYEEMKNTENLFIYSKHQFWIITGFLIYLAGSFFIYIFANQVDKDFLLN